ncbi:abortive phage infection protein [Streptomyces sp. NPDC086549]|uniref:abortive phage infection protein n=1 Tax=Streptomyces sp. NPDC086549 TaxID=3365752 RepID=UPI00381D2876
MKNTKGISRARFLAGTASAGLAAALLPAGTAQATQRRHGLRHRGVVYTVGEGETPGTAFSTARMREDVRVIRDELHADTVDVTGDGVERLTATAAEAAERGLHIWLQPTLGDVPERDILEHLAETGRFAERLRRQGASVDFSVGCEFWLFVPGIVPGETVLERVQHLLDGNVDLDRMQRLLDRFTAKAAAVGRSVFRGRLSYAAAEDDQVDWRLFDIVGIDYYAYHRHRADHVRELRRHLRPGKPLAITEFGTCAYVGAPETDGMGWNVVDHDKDPEEIKGHLVRSEHAQAAYLADLVDVFSAMNLYAAMAFEFVTPDAPHRPDDPLHDLDIASYAITKTIMDCPDDPHSGWHWEPKKAFHALAGRYAAGESRGTLPTGRATGT